MKSNYQWPSVRHGKCKFCYANNDTDKHPHIRPIETAGGCYCECDNCRARTETRKTQGEAVACWMGGHYTIPVQSEADIYRECVNLMQGLVDEFGEWLDWMGIKPEDEEAQFSLAMHPTEIVNRLFLCHTHHSGGTSTRAKCRELGIKDPSRSIKFEIETEEEE